MKQGPIFLQKPVFIWGGLSDLIVQELERLDKKIKGKTKGIFPL